MMAAICLRFSIVKMPIHDDSQATLTVIVISVKGVFFLVGYTESGGRQILSAFNLYLILRRAECCRQEG